MKKLIVGILIAFCSPVNSCAQTVEILNASRQGWSGGIAGNYGIKYSITLKLSPKNCKLDSIYINDRGYKLDSKPGGNVERDTLQHALIINVGEGHHGGRDDNYNVQFPGQHVRHFEGAALIVYQYRSKPYTFIVKKMEELPPLAFP